MFTDDVGCRELLMAGFFELIKVLSLLIGLGALTYMGFAVISGSAEFGNGAQDMSGTIKTSGLVFLVSAFIYGVSGRLQNRKD